MTLEQTLLDAEAIFQEENILSVAMNSFQNQQGKEKHNLKQMEARAWLGLDEICHCTQRRPANLQPRASNLTA